MKMKMNYKLYYFITLVILLKAVNAETMTLSEVKHLDLGKYYSDSNCPSYATKGSSYGASCTFVFYCKDNKCQSDDYDSPYFKYISESGETKNYIKKICPKKTSKNKDVYNCTTEKCSLDSDCLSNKCEGGICIQGSNPHFFECSDVYSEEKGKSIQVMRCGKLNGEECVSKKNDEECAGSCMTGSINGGVCYSHMEMANSGPDTFQKALPMLLYAVFFFVIGLVFICSCYRKCCGSSKKSEKDEDDEQQQKINQPSYPNNQPVYQNNQYQGPPAYPNNQYQGNYGPPAYPNNQYQGNYGPPAYPNNQYQGNYESPTKKNDDFYQ